MTTKSRLRPVPPLGMNINIHVFLIFIIYNIYNICPLLFFFNSYTSRSTSSGGLLADFQSESEPQTSANDLMCYFAIRNECDDGLDIMAWWKRHERSYPTLAMMVRDVFAVPVSTVPSESCFSLANRILSDKRSKLGAHVFRETCVLERLDSS